MSLLAATMSFECVFSFALPLQPVSATDQFLGIRNIGVNLHFFFVLIILHGYLLIFTPSQL